MSTLLRLLPLLILLLAAAGCGKKGPLYLPQESRAVAER